MKTKDIKITYNELIKRRVKLSNKRGWIDKRLTEIADPEIIIKLTNEGLFTDDRIRDIGKQINQLELTHRFLKTRGYNYVSCSI